MKTSKLLEKAAISIITFLIQAWILKLLWNSLGPAQGLATITWLEGLGWLVMARTLLGTGDIVSSIKKSANAKG